MGGSFWICGFHVVRFCDTLFWGVSPGFCQSVWRRGGEWVSI